MNEIETTLVAPDHVAAVTSTSAGVVLQHLQEIADERRWLEISKAAREDLAHDLRGHRPTSLDGIPLPTDEVAAIAAVKDCLQPLGPAYAAIAERAEDAVTQFRADFDQDGPLWERVDGRRMLSALDTRLATAAMPAGSLHARLKGAALSGQLPSILIDEMQGFLVGLQQALA